ncbi:oxidative stress-induced growth inhibitor 2-like [Dendronephthya gigantea]|uniref:oxidative stress-induced growth inhibitor 2-like n=1 Tax=Dendronephthya gigantea TaxID=151771 RepID=UPI00106A7323|nr:oxidative stress-induced growth inhibitor 2-like [Dendronephthya gigantea]
MNSPHENPYSVVIIGNGPSGISLSNILSGNFPYFNGKVPECPQPEESFLYDKCKRDINVSIIEQDLEYLSEGLQGRSTNPVGLLFDHLNQPNADTGLHEESTLAWRRHHDRGINHLVVGRGRSGGSWHQMQGSQLTVSLNKWLDLPGWTFSEWLKQHHKEIKQTSSCCQLARNEVVSMGNLYDRASTSHVAEYYENYVSQQGLEKHFMNNTTITSVTQKDNVWEICGTKRVCCKFSSCKKSFRVFAENIVLANGLSKSKKLSIDGEGLPFVHHHARKVVQLTKPDVKSSTKIRKPVLVVGDGLSAADVVLELFSHEIPVIHVLRHDLNDEELVLNKMPTQVYHDYAKVKDMMAKPVFTPQGDCLYHAYFKCQLLSISKHKECKLKMQDGKCQTVQVSAVFILIGSRPELSFLKDIPPLGVDPTKDVDCRHNPIDIDPYTYECKRVKNMFAMGPLVGDNFVRFGIGGALGIASHLHKSARQ